jgi:S-methylmethionine-dependent homocysteine/selenocysteine methylase
MLLEVSLLVIKSYICITLIFVSVHNYIYLNEATLMKKAVQNIKAILYFLVACFISNTFEKIVQHKIWTQSNSGMLFEVNDHNH